MDIIIPSINFTIMGQRLRMPLEIGKVSIYDKKTKKEVEINVIEAEQIGSSQSIKVKYRDRTWEGAYIPNFGVGTLLAR